MAISSTTADASVAAVVVTHNRLSLLRQCIASVRSQTRVPDEIIVVDNGSTDETPLWLEQQSDLTVLTQANQGGSGGQCSGIKTAVKKKHDWIWCMDDDAIPCGTTLARLLAAPCAAREDVGFLCSLVLWTDGHPHRMNVPALDDDVEWLATVLKDNCVSIRSCSFVSLLVARRAVEAVGLPLRELFIWLDDIEYTSRLASRFRGYLVLDSVVFHHTTSNEGSLIDQELVAPVPSSLLVKYCYGVRNRVYLAKRAGLSAPRKAVRLARLLGCEVRRVADGVVPPEALAWCVKGLLLRPRVEHVWEERP